VAGVLSSVVKVSLRSFNPGDYWFHLYGDKVRSDSGIVGGALVYKGITDAALHRTGWLIYSAEAVDFTVNPGNRGWELPHWRLLGLHMLHIL
jgi:hypothetical protein